MQYKKTKYSYGAGFLGDGRCLVDVAPYLSKVRRAMAAREILHRF